MKKALIVLLSSLVASLSLNVQAANVTEVIDAGPICNMPPIFTSVTIAPQEIRVQSDRDVEIVLAGIVSVPDNCAVTVGYTQDSNTGLIQGAIPLKPDGSFNEKLIANVSRSNRDRGSRVYNGTLFAVDADGDKTALEYTVTVLDDEGPQISLNK